MTQRHRHASPCHCACPRLSRLLPAAHPGQALLTTALCPTKPRRSFRPPPKAVTANQSSSLCPSKHAACWLRKGRCAEIQLRAKLRQSPLPLTQHLSGAPYKFTERSPPHPQIPHLEPWLGWWSACQESFPLAGCVPWGLPSPSHTKALDKRPGLLWQLPQHRHQVPSGSQASEGGLSHRSGQPRPGARGHQAPVREAWKAQCPPVGCPGAGRPCPPPHPGGWETQGRGQCLGVSSAPGPALCLLTHVLRRCLWRSSHSPTSRTLRRVLPTAPGFRTYPMRARGSRMVRWLGPQVLESSNPDPGSSSESLAVGPWTC